LGISEDSPNQSVPAHGAELSNGKPDAFMDNEASAVLMLLRIQVSGGSSVKINLWNWKVRALCSLVCVVLLGSLSYADQPEKRLIEAGKKVKVTGRILSRSGDLVTVYEKNSGEVVLVDLNASTKVERKGGKLLFLRHTQVDATALLPGLPVTVEGPGNAEGQIEADKITFVPDAFAVEVAEEQQIMANHAAAKEAQSTANRGVAAAEDAQSAAEQAQTTANEAGQIATEAAALGMLDAQALQIVNSRASGIDDYKTVAEAGIYFANDQTALDGAAKKDLDMLAAVATSLDGYTIEISGYASASGPSELNQKLSEERAAAVTRYLEEVKDISARRIVAPVGYGSTHPDAPNTDVHGRALNRRVEVKVLVHGDLQHENVNIPITLSRD
jgi:outer membrane protein OmpA-like peptidoglycan-associated protein